MNLPGLYLRSLDGRTIVTLDDVRDDTTERAIGQDDHGKTVLGPAVRLRVHSGPGDIDQTLGDLIHLRDWLSSIIASDRAQHPTR
jgi:hypothetical protein